MNEEITISAVDATYTMDYGYGLYKLIEALSKLIDEVQVIVRDGNINIDFMDPARISLCKVEINDSIYSSIFIREEDKFGVNITDLAKIMKVNKSDNKKFKIDFKDKVSIIKLKNGFSTTKTLSFLDIEMAEIPFDNLQKIDYPTKVVMKKSFMEDLFREVGDYSEILDIKVNEDGIEFSESGQIGEAHYDIKAEDLEKLEINDDEQSSAYSLTYLSMLKSFLSIMNKNQEIQFNLKTDNPLHITINFDDLGITFNMWIAPRIEEEDFDDDDDEF